MRRQTAEGRAGYYGSSSLDGAGWLERMKKPRDSSSDAPLGRSFGLGESKRDAFADELGQRLSPAVASNSLKDAGSGGVVESDGRYTR
jgi:hypothetical protein